MLALFLESSKSFVLMKLNLFFFGIISQNLLGFHESLSVR